MFPSNKTAQRCHNFLKPKEEPSLTGDVKILELSLDNSKEVSKIIARVSPSVSALIFHKDLFPIAKQYWQHSGDGISSRHAEFCHSLFADGKLADSMPLQPVINQKEAQRGTKEDLYIRLASKKTSYLRKSRELRAAGQE